MNFTVYILESERLGKYYVGSTSDVEARILRHNQGRSKYTKSGMPWRLVYTEDYATRSEAVNRERQIKRRKSLVYIED